RSASRSSHGASGSPARRRSRSTRRAASAPWTTSRSRWRRRRRRWQRSRRRSLSTSCRPRRPSRAPRRAASGGGSGGARGRMAARGSDRVTEALEELLVELPGRVRGGTRRVSDQALSLVRAFAEELNLVTRDDLDELELRVAQLEHRLRLLERANDSGDLPA